MQKGKSQDRCRGARGRLPFLLTLYQVTGQALSSHKHPANETPNKEPVGKLTEDTERQTILHAIVQLRSRSVDLPEAPLLHLLEQHGVHNLFAAHRTWDDIIRRKEKEKPEPDMLLSVMRELDADPRETVMVGDTIMDVKMGIAANTHTIGVAWGMHPVQHLVDAGAHHIIETPFTQIVPVVRKIFA